MSDECTTLGGSPATRRRARLRRCAKQRGVLEALALFRSMMETVGKIETSFGRHMSSCLVGDVTSEGCSPRDMFPLPTASQFLDDWPLAASKSGRSHLVHLVNASVVGLNCLHNSCSPCRPSGRANKVQRFVLASLAGKWWRLAEHARSDDGPIHVEGAFKGLVARGASMAAVPLRAELVDLPQRCGGVCADVFLPDEVRDMVQDPNKLFKGSVPSPATSVRQNGGARAEYVMLVRRQCRAGKVLLSRTCQHAASTFTVRKKDTSSLREVWNGSELSKYTIDPPPLPRLGTPSALCTLESSDDRPLLLSSRDGASFFDQLRLPKEMRDFVGRPPVTVYELCRATYTAGKHPGQGPLTTEELRSCMRSKSEDEIDVSAALYPLSAVWPMGHSWSAAVAQHVMTGTCAEAGIDRSQFMTDAFALTDADLPAVAVAIDDVNLFERAGETNRQGTRSGLHELDDVWARHNIQEKLSKRLDRSSSGTVLGMTLVQGKLLLPKRSRLLQVVNSLIEILEHPHTSPAHFASYLGTIQWMVLARRPLFSIFHASYQFAKNDQDTLERALPGKVLSELGVFASLLCHLVLDLRADWAPIVPASDGSSSFGYGACWAKCDPTIVREAVASNAGNIAKIFPADADCDVNDGDYRLPCTLGDFRSLFSIRSKHQHHSSKVEIGAFSLVLRRLSRSTRWHKRRIMVLTDSMATLFCVRKGRTSSSNMFSGMSQIAAVSLACDMFVHPCFVPTAWNPADDESRGRGRRAAPAKGKGPVKKTRFDQYMHDFRRSVRKLTANGFLSECSDTIGDWCSSCSSSTLGQPSLD